MLLIKRMSLECICTNMHEDSKVIGSYIYDANAYDNDENTPNMYIDLLIFLQI
jgi:hypothetical protein